MHELVGEPFELRPSAQTESVLELKRRLPAGIPNDYFEFLLLGDGGIGNIGGGDYAMIWPTGEIEGNNIEYEATTYAPGLVLFGSNGGGEAFAFDTTQTASSIGIVPFVGLSREEYRPIATTFLQFLNQLAAGLNYDEIIGARISRH